MTKPRPPTKVEYGGKTYTVTRTFKKGGKLAFECDTSDLFGPNKNTVLAELVDTVYLSDGTVMTPGK